jgi:hypothetical protein
VRKIWVLLAVLLCNIPAIGKDEFDVDDIKVRCDCDKDEKEWRKEPPLAPQLVAKLAAMRPRLRDIVIPKAGGTRS